MTDLAERLERAKNDQASYRPNEIIAEKLGGVTFGALVGISGVGKSHLIPHIIQQGGEDFSELGNISTRAKRPSDHQNFRGDTSHEALLDRIDAHELVSYVVHPSGDIYASDLESYRTNFILLPTLTSALPQLEALGCFKQIIPISLAVDGATWEERFTSKLDDPKLAARLDEALVCLEWQKEHVEAVPIIYNQTGGEIPAALIITAILRGQLPAGIAPSNLSLLEDLREAVQRKRQQLLESV